MSVRQPAVAGRFYPSSPESLRKELARCIPDAAPKRPVKGLVSPHAGYVYSGAVAGAVFAGVELPSRVVILGPNHTGRGSGLAIQGAGVWRTPLGDVPIDAALAGRLRDFDPELEEDAAAHQHEHSLEVQLPFLQALTGQFSFVPICVGTSRLETLLRLGGAIAETVAEAGEPVLLVSSSDMTHYETAISARKKDEKAIERMLALDPEGLFRTVREGGISMCGFAPTVVVMQACRRLGAERGELVRYTNSGEVSGDYSSVVGYAGLVFV